MADQGEGIVTGLVWALEGGVIAAVGAGSAVLIYDVAVNKKDALGSLVDSFLFWLAGGFAGAVIGGIAGAAQPGLARADETVQVLPEMTVGERNPFESYEGWPDATIHFY